MRRIFKYQLSGFRSDIQLPKGARVVKVAIQKVANPVLIAGRQEIVDIPTFWAIVNPEADIETKSFLLCATGQPIPDGAEYRGTYFVDAAVFHLFEIAGAGASAHKNGGEHKKEND